jgi:hypothetical protein
MVAHLPEIPICCDFKILFCQIYSIKKRMTVNGINCVFYESEAGGGPRIKSCLKKYCFEFFVCAEK